MTDAPTPSTEPSGSRRPALTAADPPRASRLRPALGAVVARTALSAVVALFVGGAAPWAAHAQVARNPVELSLERLVELGLRDSYRVRQLQLDIERTRSLLRAEQAGLKSRVELEIAAPEFEVLSEEKWNSDLQRNELISENTQRWEVDLSIRQPVILFGFPTNGYLSLNNRIYRYRQIGDEDDISYYNRYFIGYNQPLFQPNRMKNELEEAEMDLERSELEYTSDVVGIVDDLAEDYYELFEDAYERKIFAAEVADLEAAMAAAQERVAADPTSAIELDQLRVELANAREEMQRASSSFRLNAASIKQRLRLAPADSIVLDPVLRVTPANVDSARAVELATTLAPRLRQLALSRREDEIRLEETRGNDSFRMNVGLTYGREMQDPRFQHLWTEPSNSYTLNVSGYIPLWDWGERKHRIQAQRYSLEQTDLQIEEARSSIQTDVANEIRNLQEFEQRALNMQENLQFAEQITTTTIDRYRAGEVDLVGLLQTIDREAATARNFLDAYLGYQNTLLRLQQLTYYDFQGDMPLMDRFRIEPYSPDAP
jgi:outer membrane protein